MKFMHYLKKIAEETNFDLTTLTDQQFLKLYNDSYIPPHDNPNTIFYHVREPHISKKIRNIFKSSDDYLRYHKDLEGSTDKIIIRNYGFDCFFIIDGFFELAIGYNETFEIKTANNKLRTIHKF